MKKAATAAAFAVATFGAAVEEERRGQVEERVHEYTRHGYKSSEQWKPRVTIPGAVAAETLLGEVPLPKVFDWRNVNGKSLVVADWNQHIPQYCGACWVHGTTMALTDRIKVYRQGAFPDVILGRQAIINCVPNPEDPKLPPPGCHGGDSWIIHEYLHAHKIPDETCLPYQARNMGCSAENVCRNCYPGSQGCFAVKNWVGYGVSSYGQLSGEEAMMKEIYARGPIACTFATDNEFMLNFYQVVEKNDEHVYYTGQKFNKSQIDHVMEVAGWGETANGLKYWVIRNSWGTYWGEAGWFKLRRGTNELLSEGKCDWAVPTFDDLDAALAGRIMGDYVLGTSAVELGEGVVPVAPSGGVAIDLVARGSSDGPGPDELASAASPAATGPWQFVLAVVASFACGVMAVVVSMQLAGRTRQAAREAPLLG